MTNIHLVLIIFTSFCIAGRSFAENDGKITDLLRQLQLLSSSGNEKSELKAAVKRKQMDDTEQELLNELRDVGKETKRDHVIPDIDLSKLKCSDMYIQMREKVDSLAKKYCRPQCQGYMHTCAENSDCCDGFRCYVWQCKPWNY